MGVGFVLQSVLGVFVWVMLWSVCGCMSVWGGLESIVCGCVWEVLEGIFGDVDCVGWPVAPAVMVGDITVMYTVHNTVYMYSYGGKFYCNIHCTVLTIQ